MDWHNYFMNLVYLVSMRSKDESTHIGAVIVRPDKSIASTGYNSFCSGMDDSVKERQDRPLKYFYFEHAETNAIHAAAKHGTAIKGCTLYTNGIPCADCARAIIQAGIVKVYYDALWESLSPEKWKESAKHSLAMFDECGVDCQPLARIKLFQPIRFMRGKYLL